MNETQLKEFYDLVTSKDPTYSSKVSFDSFKQKMQSSDYASRLKSWAGVSEDESIQPPTQQQPPAQQPVTAFNAADLLKKKSIQSVSSSDQSSSASTSDGDGLTAMQEALSYKPQPLPSEGTRAGVPPIQQQQQVKQQIQKREEKRVEKMTQSPQFFKDQISGINADLMSKEEEYVVPQLNYKFGPMGFKFEESGISNQMVVTAPNGKQKTIDLLYGGIPIVIAPSLAVGSTGKAMEEADAKARTKEPIAELKQFILDNSVDTKDLSRYESLYAGQKAKYETTKQAEDAIKSASDEYNAINAKINSYSKESAMADKMFEELNKVPEDQRDAAYNKRYDEAIEMKQRAIANANSIDADRYYASSVKYKDVEKSVGDYFMMKSEQGTWMGGLANRALKSTGSILSGLVDVGIVGSAPQLAFTPSMVKGRDEIRSGLTNFFIDNFKDKSTTEQWDAATSQSTVKGAILGLGGMIPAMAAGAVAGGAGFMGAFAAEGYNDTMIEAQEAGIPPGERELVAIPVGITMGVIGELGLDKIPGAKVFAKQVTAKALKVLGADFTATTFKNFVQNEIKSSIARGAITAGKGFVHGFEMGVKMDVGTNLIKDTYNVIKDKRDENENYMKVFNTPDSIAEYFSSAVESGISMGIGGAILGTPDIMKAAAEKNNFNGISDSHLEMFDLMSKDDMFNSLTTLKVKQDIIDGKITKEQGELQLRSYQQLASLMKSLPDGLTNAQKRKALGLLQEKVLLKSQIEKGDPALTKKQRDRVAEIDNFLEQISEGKYSEVSEIKPEDVKVTIGDKVMWNPDVTKEMEQWDVAEVKDDSVTLTKGEETQTIPLKELQQHITDTYAVQKPTADESVLRAKQPELELPKVGEGDQKPDVVKTEEQVGEEKVAELTPLQQATEARRKAKENLNSIRQGFGIDPTARTRALVDYHKALVTEAKEYIKEKAGDFAEWAKTTGENVSAALQKAWDEASGKIAPIEKAEDLGYKYEDVFGKREMEYKAMMDEIDATAKALEEKFNPDFKNTIVEKLSKFDKQIADKNFPSALEVAEHVLPRSIFNKYKALYELAARNNITVTNAAVPNTFNYSTGMINKFVAGWGFDNIHINKEGIKDSVLDYNEFAEVLNHEIIHGLINKGIRDDYGLHRDLEYIMDEVESRFDNASEAVKDIISYIQDTAKQYKVRDILNATAEESESGNYRKTKYLEELITYAFTNKEFADFLDSIPATKKIESKGNSIFQQLKNIIRGFVSKITKGETALDEINSVLDKYFDSSWNEKSIAKRNKEYNWGLKFKAEKNIFDKYNNDPKLIAESYHKGNDVKLIKAVNEKLGTEIKAEKGVGVTETKTALQQATEARKKAKQQLNSISQGFGIDPTARTRALVKYHKALVSEAKEFIKEKAGDFAEWAKTMGGELSASLKKAWDEATEAIKPIENAEELGYDFQDLFGEEVSKIPGFEDAMRDVQQEVDMASRKKKYWEDELKKAKDKGDVERQDEVKKQLEEHASQEIKDAMEKLKSSKAYQAAEGVQQELMVREVNKMFELREQKSPKADKLLGQQQEKTVQMTPAQAIKEQIRNMAKGAKVGEKGMRDAIKQIVDYVKGVNLNKGDLKKVMDLLSGKIADEKGLNAAIEKVFDIVDKSNSDLIEVSKEKIEKEKLKAEREKMKAEIKARKEGAKSVTEKVKAIKEYFESVKEYGNLTRKDLRKIMNEMSKVKDEKSLDKAVDKINDIIDNAKTDIIEISELKMIKDKLKGIKDAKKDLNEKRKLIAAAIDFIAKSGKINAKKVGNMLNSLLKVNLNEDAKIEKIIEYVENSFLDAEYDAKRTEAKSLLSSIKKLSKNIEVDANYKKLAEEFKKINPSEVADIDLYIENAKKLNEAMKGAFGKELKDSASINELSEYTEERLTEQREAAEKEMQDKLMELGVDATGLSMKEMKEIFDALSDEKKKPSKEQEKVARDTAKKAFDTYSAIIKEMLRTKQDPFTGEPIEFTETQRDLIERFMKMDLDLLSGKESIAAANSLINFITNGSISKMGKVVEKYEKLSSIKNVADKGIIAKTFRAWWSKDIGRVLMEQIATLPNVFSRAFKNDKIGEYVMKALGLSDVIQMHMKAVKESNAITDEYVKEFYNKKGKEFRSDESTIERGMLAFMLRSKPGAEAESFADRKKLIEDSIEVLSKGDERQQKMSELYQKVYDKILSDSKTADEVRSKSNADNVEAVDWWVNKWAEKYEGLSDVLESVYNKILGNDINYTPDKVKLVDPKQGKNDLNQDYSVFLQNNGLYMEESGVLMEKKIKNELPDNRYIDLSFDLNNTMSMHDALVDMYTAAKVEGLNAAINSPFFAKIFPNRADRNLVIDLTKGYVRDMRQKTISDMNEINSAARKLGAISSMGVSMSLAGPTQILKQSIPIMVNTFINAGPVNMLSNLFSRGGFDFIDSLDMPISIRGKEATTQLQSVNRLVELAARSNGNEAMKIIEVANKRLLKLFLTNADVYVAKASWLAYYEKYMKDNKLTKGPIDFRTEKLNQEAADYAQKMVDKNQNVSVRELQGKMFKTKDPTKRFLVQMLLPFANYRMNQKVRMGNDMATIWSKTTSLSDKATAARSLAATGAESLAFRAMSGLISYTLWNMTNGIMGRDVDDEEKEKYIDNLYKGGYTALITDFVSPIPPADPFVADGANTIMRKFQEDILNMEEDEVIGLFDGTNRKEKLQALGLFGIPLQRANQIAETIELANTGEFKDDFGRIRILDEEDQEAMKTFAFISMLSITGVSFPEMNSIIKGGIKMAKKNASVESALSYEEQQRREESKQQKEKEKSEKIKSVDELIDQETDEDVIRELNKIKTDLQEGIDKQERIEEKEKMEKLLQGYESKSDMKRYDPVLYEETFGEGSDYYEENKAEIEAEKNLSKYMKKKKDEEYDYIEKRKKKKESDSFFEEEKTTEFFKSKKEGGFFD